MQKDSLGDRMKGYEGVPSLRLMPKTPVMIRLDGKAFHTLTRTLKKPIDIDFVHAMCQTARHLCQEISGVRLAYLQSDEITLLLTDYVRLETQGWFGYEVQKLVSVSASMAAARFGCEWPEAWRMFPAFDARCWNLPLHEVTNCFIWRQQDCTRNSISALAQAHFSHRELQKKSGPEMQDMLMEKGINWNDCPVYQKRGVCIVRGPDGWVVDWEIPIFTQDREYVERWVRVDAE